MNQLTRKSENPNCIPVHSDVPTETFVTPKAIMFYISSVATVVAMFLNWLPINLDLGYFEVSDVFGTVNLFTLFGTVADLADTVGIFDALLPDVVASAMSFLKLAGFVAILFGIVTVGLYVCAIYLRIKGDDKCVRFGRAAALAAIGSVAFFVLLIVICAAAINMMDAFVSVVGEVFTGPCMLTLVCASISGFCAVRNTRFKENVVIYHNGVIKIDNGPLWRCSCCYRRNLSLLQKCYYCGTEK